MTSALTLSTLLLLTLGLSAQTTDAEAVSNSAGPISHGFIAICCALVFIMQAGFCLLEVGFSRSKNSINIVMKNVLDFAVGTVGFCCVGFGLLFGASYFGLIGLDFTLLTNSQGADAPVWMFMLFQVMFATAAVTISSGAMAERTFFPGYLTYAFIACLVLYPVLGHWVWGGAGAAFGLGSDPGWLAAMGFRDFAGSTVVHSVGGAFALAGIIVVGPRLGRFFEDGSARLFPGHNAPLSALGMFLLIFGWFGFNMGSNLVADGNLGRIGICTVLAAATGLIGSFVTHWIKEGWADMEMSLNGALGGLVSITAACAYVSPWAALPIGLVGGILVALGGSLLLKLQLDDAVGAVPVHLFCGIWGTLAVSLFDSSEPFAGIGVQTLGAFVVPAAAFLLSYLLFIVVEKTIGLRASDEAQSQGLDFTEHSATAYPDFALSETQD